MNTARAVGGKQWYAVHTYSGHENKVKTTLERRVESLGLQDKIRRIIVPTEKELRTRGGKRTEVQSKVFPGYILIEMLLDEQTWYVVKSTSGVTGFLTSGDKPVPLKDKEIQEILRAIEGEYQKPKAKWEVDEVVRVVSGPFQELTGKIIEVDLKQEKVRALISIFGRDTPVELEFSQIERL